MQNPVPVKYTYPADRNSRDAAAPPLGPQRDTRKDAEDGMFRGPHGYPAQPEGKPPGGAMDEKTWERMREILLAEATGHEPRPVVSKRTLFGIPSHVETVIQRTVEEDEAKKREKRKRESENPR